MTATHGDNTGPLWRFHFGDREKRTRLRLVWEVSSDPISDDYTPERISALDLLAVWVAEIEKSGDEFAPIAWYVEGDADYPIFESMPFAYEEDPYNQRFAIDHSFLQYFTWPTGEHGERLQWTRLPVADKLWRTTPTRRADKGGFIQEVTGWKPSPLQDRVHWPALLAASGIKHRSMGTRARPGIDMDEHLRRRFREQVRADREERERLLRDHERALDLLRAEGKL